MKFLRDFSFATILGLASTSFAGDPNSLSYVEQDAPPAYEGGRGLITFQGPTGMFLNPTSGTMNAGDFTAQYCFFSPHQFDKIVGHNWLAAYAVTDWLEIAGLASYNDSSGDGAGGPQVRVRLMKNEGIVPQVSVGYYGLYGAGDRSTAYAAAYNRISINEAGFVKSLGLHYGIRNTWFDAGEDELRVYGGIEIQLPLRLYIIGEIATKDDDIEADEIPYTYGLQWRMGGINISAAMIEPGNLGGGESGGPGFYFGVGTQLSF